MSTQRYASVSIVFWKPNRQKGPYLNVLTAPGKRLFLTGDEAVARAALEAGVHVVTGYPGNPSTKAITALIPIARQYGITVEWSVNEKVALEVATGAAWAGKRGLVTMKMSGINVMADSLLSIAHSGVTGALVIYAVDDIGTYYGMVEQDSRYYAHLATLPLLMPCSPEEAYAMTHLAFSVSEQTGAPVMLLSTTAVSNAITAMKVGKIERNTEERPANFERNLAKFTKAVSQWCRDQHADALTRLWQACKLFDKSEGINQASLAMTAPSEQATTRRLGIVVAGVSYAYLQELRQRSPEFFSNVSIFKIGSVYPLPRQALRDFLAQVDVVLTLEELEPIIETQLLAIIAETGLNVEVYGKRNGLLPRVGDYTLELIEQAILTLGAQRIAPSNQVDQHAGNNVQHEVGASGRPEAGASGRPQGYALTMTMPRPLQSREASAPIEAPLRALEFCPGCPHRLTYYALNRAIEKLGFSSDDIITTDYWHERSPEHLLDGGLDGCQHRYRAGFQIRWNRAPCAGGHGRRHLLS